MEREGRDSAAGVALGQAAAKRGVQATANGWPVDDITGLARRLPEVNPANYFDGQAKDSFEQSLLRWPVLARMMKLVPADHDDKPLQHESTQKLTVVE
jgi:hypothetical protein